MCAQGTHVSHLIPVSRKLILSQIKKDNLVNFFHRHTQMFSRYSRMNSEHTYSRNS